MDNLIIERINESIKVKQKLLDEESLLMSLDQLADQMVMSIKNSKKIVLCGNGGSASDAIHFAAEIVGRFEKERAAWPAIVLNSDIATMTAISNDYSYDEIFARQAEAHVNREDIFIGISTSGNSENVYRAINVAKQKGAKTVGLLGKDGGKIKDCVDFPLVIPSNITARVQECHILLIHILCELIESRLEHE